MDIHGSTIVWRKWIKAVEEYKADVLILAGDLTGKVLVPIVKHVDGNSTARYFGRRWVMNSESEIREFEERLEGAGAYYIRVDEKELEEMKSSPDLVSKLMNEKMVERLRLWLQFLIKRIDTKRTTTIVMPGNDDEYLIDNVIREFEDYGVIYPLDKVIEIERHEVISSPYVNPTPWSTPREMEERDLEKYLEKLVSKVRNPRTSILNSHCPPYGTHLDLAPKLDKNLRPVFIGGMPEYVHVGSRAVRKIIEKYKFLIGLHGHIHESGGMDRLGDTVVLNPGSEYSEGVLRGFIIELSNEKLVNYWRVEG